MRADAPQLSGRLFVCRDSHDDAQRFRALTRETETEFDQRQREEGQKPQLDRKTRKQKGLLFESQGNHRTY